MRIGPHESAPGVMVTIVAQSEYFVSGDSCLRVDAGHAVLAPGANLPVHRTGGYELVVPISGELQASNRNRDFLRTDSDRQWQDELPFATLDSSVAVVAPPDSWTTYMASAQEPASDSGSSPSSRPSSCSSSGSSSTSS